MRIVVLVVAVFTGLLMPAQAAQVMIWPSQFSYGTPAGTFTWNSTAIGLRLDQPIGPFLALGTTLYYGPISNFSFAGSSLSGYSGQTLAGDISLRMGVSAGPLGLTAYAGYGGFGLNASGPSAPDRVVLSSLGFRTGTEAKVPLAPALSLQGSWTFQTGVNSSANISLSSPFTAAQHSGVGSGSEYQLVVVFSPLPRTGFFAGYRGGSHQNNWSGGGTTTTSYSGPFAGFEIRF
ncbi:MAG TPA: hypothetical protein VFH67_07085 [bacterium]|nr:hypothetical protein [bacterium]